MNETGRGVFACSGDASTSTVQDLDMLGGGTQVVVGFGSSTGLTGLTRLLGSGVASTMVPKAETDALFARRAPAPPVRLGVPTRSMAGTFGAVKLLLFVGLATSSVVELLLNIDASPAKPTLSLRFTREDDRLAVTDGG